MVKILWSLELRERRSLNFRNRAPSEKFARSMTTLLWPLRVMNLPFLNIDIKKYKAGNLFANFCFRANSGRQNFSEQSPSRMPKPQVNRGRSGHIGVHHKIHCNSKTG